MVKHSMQEFKTDQHAAQHLADTHTLPPSFPHRHEFKSLLCTVALSCRLGYDVESAAVPIKQCQMYTFIQNITSTRHRHGNIPKDLPLKSNKIGLTRDTRIYELSD